MAGTQTDLLFSLVYEELRRLAYTVKRNDGSATLNPTALVHEAWLKLANAPQLSGASPLHFKRIAARAMRQVLVDAARRRHTAKRHDAAVLVEFNENLGHGLSSAADVVALDQALQELETLDPRRAAGIEARFFGGFTAVEIGELLNISEETVAADWRGSKAWLSHKLRGDR